MRPDRIKAFLVALSNRRAEWQVKQAERAISLYVYYTKGAKSRNEDRDQNAFLPSPSDWVGVKEEVVRLLRLRHLSYRTEKTYLGWLRRFAQYVSHKSSTDVTQTDLTDFLSYLSVEQKVSASTQRQAFNALLFVFRNILGKQIEGLEGTIRSAVRRRLPVVLSRKEIARIFTHMSGTHGLAAGIIYGAGLRLQECLMLRIKDIDFERGCITVRAGKGDKDRQTLLPDNLKTHIKNHIREIRKIHERDRSNGVEGVWLPWAFDRKYLHSGKEWGWFWLFPSHRLSVDPHCRKIRRHHLYP